MGDYITINEASKLSEVSRRTILKQIKENRASAYFDGKRWLIRKEDVLEGRIGVDRRSRWGREYEVDGECVFSKEEGCVSVSEAAKQTGVNQQQIYYGIRMGFLAAERRGFVWVVKVSDVERYRDEKVKGFASHPNAVRRRKERDG